MQCAAEGKYCAGVLGQLRGRAAAQPRSLEGTLLTTIDNTSLKFSGRVCLKMLVLRTPYFGALYPQGVRGYGVDVIRGVDVPRLFLKLGYLSSTAICDGNSRHCLRLCGCNHRICYGSTKLQSSSFKRWFSSLPYAGQGCRQRWGSGARPPHLKLVPPISRLAGCYIHPILYFKNVAPLLVFGSSWFLAPPAATSWRRAWCWCVSTV